MQSRKAERISAAHFTQRNPSYLVHNNEIAILHSFYSLQSIKKQTQSSTPQTMPSSAILALQDSSLTEATGTWVSVHPAPAQVFGTRGSCSGLVGAGSSPATSKRERHVGRTRWRGITGWRSSCSCYHLPRPCILTAWKFLQNPVTYRNSIDQTSKLEGLNTSAYTPPNAFEADAEQQEWVGRDLLCEGALDVSPSPHRARREPGSDFDLSHHQRMLTAVFSRDHRTLEVASWGKKKKSLQRMWKGLNLDGRGLTQEPSSSPWWAANGTDGPPGVLHPSRSLLGSGWDSKGSRMNVPSLQYCLSEGRINSWPQCDYSCISWQALRVAKDTHNVCPLITSYTSGDIASSQSFRFVCVL